MTSWWLFPPLTEEVQFDEKWSFVYQKEKRCVEGTACDRQRGDNWDHVALDPEHRLVLESVGGKRSRRLVRQAVRAVKRKLGGRVPRLITSDEFRPYRGEILDAFGVATPPAHTGLPGRPRKGHTAPHPDLLYATVHKTRKDGRVVKIEPRVIFGSQERLDAALKASTASRAVNTAFIERQNGTDRHRNSRKVRKTYRFSKDWDTHNACSWFSLFLYNFCWPVRTLRQKLPGQGWQDRTPAMSAGLTDHVWTLYEWLSFPARSA